MAHLVQTIFVALACVGVLADVQDSEGVNRPVAKVISLLKEMLVTLEKEGEADKEVFDKMDCWCDTGRKDKTKSIADAKTHIGDLTAAIDGHDAKMKRLASEIKALEKEVAANQVALDQATSIREKEQSAFNQEEKDLLESISALKAAITVLSKHQPGGASSFLQVDQSQQLSSGVMSRLQQVMQMHGSLLKGVLSPKQRKLITSFLQAGLPKDTDFNEQYGTTSGQIFGILGSMKDTFEANLSDSQKEEMRKQKEYDELKAGKEAEIAAGQSQLEDKSEELANSDQNLANAKQDKKDTEVSLAADEEYLSMLEEKCSQTDAEFDERQKTRTAEVAAVTGALKVLSDNDNTDLFGKTFNKAAFVQTKRQSTRQDAAKQRASILLRNAATKLGSNQLSALAAQVQLDAFTEVIEMIDKMIAALAQEKADEIKSKDFCNNALNENELKTEKATRKKVDLTAQIEALTQEIQDLADAIEANKKDMEEMKFQMQRASENREKENADFHMTVQDQTSTIDTIKKALNFLKDFYEREALVQQPAGPPPPAGFKAYEDNKQAGGVMGMIQTIISDAEQLKNEAITDEASAQHGYEALIKETNKGLWAKEKDTTAKGEAKAQKEGELVDTKNDLKATNGDLDALANNDKALHGDCDFVLKNFDLRQTARDQETEALKQAKAILKGANYE